MKCPKLSACHNDCVPKSDINGCTVCDCSPQAASEVAAVHSPLVKLPLMNDNSRRPMTKPILASCEDEHCSGACAIFLHTAPNGKKCQKCNCGIPETCVDQYCDGSQCAVFRITAKDGKECQVCNCDKKN